MEGESWRNRGEESWRRNHGGATMEDASWRSQHGGDSEEEAGGTRRHPGGARRHPGGPQAAAGSTQEAARRQDLYLCQAGNYDCIFTVFLSTVPFICHFYEGFLRVGVIMYAFLHGKSAAPQIGGSRSFYKTVIQDRENPISKARLAKIE